MLDITVYSLPTSVCIKCKAVEISMRRKGIQAKKVMVNEDEVAMEFIKSLGYTEAPVLVVEENGQVVDHWSGFSDSRMNALKDRVAA